tara:strand:+ start:1313 stop:1852 length:540 start_codon:yes stop_codon:yes gene_type:complete
MGFFSDLFGGSKRKSKERDYWKAEATRMTTYAHGLAAENQARIKMADANARARAAERRNYETQARKSNQQLQRMRAQHNATVRRANQRMEQQRATFTRQAKEARIAREKFAFAQSAVEDRKVKTAKLQSKREQVVTPSVTGQQRKQQGSLLAQRTKPRRRVVGSKRKRGYGGTNTRRPR